MDAWALPAPLPKSEEMGKLRLDPGDVHVVLVTGESSGATRLDYLESVLSNDERQKIARLRAVEKRMEAVLSRGVLRHVLGGFLKAPPETVAIRIAEQGKPFVEGMPLHFNVSHTEGMVVLAVALDQEVGVDVENVRENVQHEELARSFFSAQELAAIQAANRVGGATAHEALWAFYRCWTRKEAILKGMGVGIGTELNRMVVPAGELRGAITIGGWQLMDLDVGPRRVGALAGQGELSRVSYWSFAV